MMTQVSAPAPTKDPLTTRDRQIIATIVNESDYSHECKPEDVVTIWINEDDIVWIKMTHGYARYHKEPLKRAVAEVKESLFTPLESNQELDDELKQAADTIGLLGDCDWLSLSIKAYSDKLVGFAGCYTSQKPQLLTPLAEWDFTPLKWNMPAAICPDCEGHGCANCSYRGTRAEDLCTPVDGYRLTYVGRTDLQTAENVYLDGEFLGIVFKVRNPNEVWENDPKTYYWRCGDGVQYWSVSGERASTMWIISPSASKALLKAFGAKLDLDNWMSGVYFLPEGVRAAIVAINKLPRTPDTLWFRLLGRGKVQREAVEELVALPPSDLVRRNVLEIIYRWRISVMTQTDLTEDDQELIMNLTEAYQEARAQAVQEGVEQGQRQVVENLLRFRFGSVDEELARMVDNLLQLAPDDFARFLLELSSLSREELLARFNSHQ